MTPPPLSVMPGRTAREQRNEPLSATETSVSHCSSSRSRRSLSVAFAALLTRTSTGPNRRRVSRAIASTSPPSATFVFTARAVPPASEISPATSLAASSATSATTTAAPSVAKRCAMCRPSPEPPPVTTTTRSENLIPTSRSPGAANPTMIEQQRRSGRALPLIPAPFSLPS